MFALIHIYICQKQTLFTEVLIQSRLIYAHTDCLHIYGATVLSLVKMSTDNLAECISLLMLQELYFKLTYR